MSGRGGRKPWARRTGRIGRAAGAAAIAVTGTVTMLQMAGLTPPAIEATARAAQGPLAAVTLDNLLERAGTYVQAFEGLFSNVVTEERYVQEVIPSNSPAVVVPSGRAGATPSIAMPSTERRELVSDLLLVKLPETGDWLPFRDVFEVDRQKVRDREDRLTKLFLKPAATDLEQALRIMEESARYNIGNVQRTINLPVLALLALRPAFQPQFRFSLGRRDSSVGAQVYIVEFQEIGTPTLVRGAYGRDMFCRGRFWIEAPTGRVMKSEFIVDDALGRASVTTRYQIDPTSGMSVPIDMKEAYALPNRSRVTGVATYGRFRRFDVRVADEIAKPPRTIADPATGMTLVEIPAGRFTMGSPSAEPGRGDDESQHEVTLTRSFFLGQSEVTQEQWGKIMNTSPSQSAACGPDCPVERVSYDDVQQFLDALNGRTSDVRYRLPSEAEWEYACRAGAATPFTTGVNITTAQANYDGARPYATFPRGMFRGQPTPAGTFDVNVWGVRDMHGNVIEWTADWYGSYPRGPALDPHGPASGVTRVVRGGGWRSDARLLRCAARERRVAPDREATIGFRVAADVTGKQ